MGSFIDFTQIHDTGKTKVFSVESKSGDHLGKIAWFPSWRKYTFMPEYGSLFDSKCLAEVIEFLSKLMEDRKNGATKG